MFRPGNLKRAIVLGIPLVAVIPAGNAWAAPSSSLSFSATGAGASAGWTHGKGSPIELTVGSDPGTNAVITFRHFADTTPSTMEEPQFTTNNYAAGSPRFYLVLNNGDTLWGYPPNSGLNGSAFAWSIDNGSVYQSWQAVQASEAGAKVTGAYVIADGDQPSGTTDTITGLTFDNATYN